MHAIRRLVAAPPPGRSTRRHPPSTAGGRGGMARGSGHAAASPLAAVQRTIPPRGSSRTAVARSPGMSGAVAMTRGTVSAREPLARDTANGPGGGAPAWTRRRRLLR